MNQTAQNFVVEAPAAQPYYPFQKAGDFIDLERIIVAVLRNRWIIGGIMAVAIALGVLVTLLTTPQFTAQASVQINQEADRILDTENVQPTVAYQDADRFLRTQLDILTSRHLVLKVVEAENLVRDADFLERAGISVDESLPAREQERVLEEAVLAHVSANVSVRLPVGTRIARISYSDPDPEFAARIANSYAETFITDNLTRRMDSSSYARSFLSEQLAEAKVRLEESERDLNTFARESGVIRLSGDQQAASSRSDTITGRSLLRLNDAATTAEAARADAEARWMSAAPIPASQLPDVVSNSAYQSLQAERSRVLAALNQELAIRQADHPSVKVLQAQAESIDTQIDRIANGIKSSIRSAYLAAAQQEETLKRRVGALQGELIEEEGRAVRYGILSREVDTNRVIYDGLLQRYKEVSAEAGITNNNLSQVDRASPPLKPSRPVPLLNMAIALLAGMVAAFGTVFVREIVDDKLRTPRDVEDQLGLNTLGLIPMHKGEEPLVEVLLDPKSSIVEAIHSLRTGVLLTLENTQSNRFMVSSSEAAEGKSSTTYALARDIANLGRSVLLIDADMRRPRMHKLIDVSNRVGLADVLGGTVSAPEAVQKPELQGFDFLSAGSQVVDAATILNSERFGALMDEFAGAYDVIIIDGPPVLGLADAPNLASKIRNVLFVVEASRGRARRVRLSMRRLAEAGGAIMGIVLTKVDFNNASYGYAYGYGYGQDYYEYKPGS